MFSGEGDRRHAATPSPHPRPFRGRRPELQIHALRRQRRGEYFVNLFKRNEQKCLSNDFHSCQLEFQCPSAEFTQPKTSLVCASMYISLISNFFTADTTSLPAELLCAAESPSEVPIGVIDGGRIRIECRQVSDWSTFCSLIVSHHRLRESRARGQK